MGSLCELCQPDFYRKSDSVQSLCEACPSGSALELAAPLIVILLCSLTLGSTIAYLVQIQNLLEANQDRKFLKYGLKHLGTFASAFKNVQTSFGVKLRILVSLTQVLKGIESDTEIRTASVSFPIYVQRAVCCATHLLATVACNAGSRLKSRFHPSSNGYSAGFHSSNFACRSSCRLLA